jgi:hypothetical protein
LIFIGRPSHQSGLSAASMPARSTNAEAELEHGERELRHGIAWMSGHLTAGRGAYRSDSSNESASPKIRAPL